MIAQHKTHKQFSMTSSFIIMILRDECWVINNKTCKMILKIRKNTTRMRSNSADKITSINVCKNSDFQINQASKTFSIIIKINLIIKKSWICSNVIFANT